jgi:hypothetical protein
VDFFAFSATAFFVNTHGNKKALLLSLYKGKKKYFQIFKKHFRNAPMKFLYIEGESFSNFFSEKGSENSPQFLQYIIVSNFLRESEVTAQPKRRTYPFRRVNALFPCW